MIKNGSVEIKSIDKKVVNQICSGQVILTLSTAVKELVENSIDANATSIQIRLKEYGAETIEVSDNGCGVEEKNFQALTLKHYTSKISDFDDVASVETFGFRGEALSSLCTLSKVGIITRHKDSLIGTKLKFDHNGIITECSKIARQIGTTVMLENIFCTLPVRHKEFLRNIKKEFSKMCNVLFAYGLLSKSVSIVCTNQVSNKKLTVMETMGETVKSNITQIFGTKQSQNLLEIEKSLPEDDAEEESGDDGNQMKLKSVDDIELEGFISSCVHGCGRSSSDRQFYYINSRPVDNVKVAKLVNDIYHQYNPHQYPFVVLNMKILMTHIDVNVTPDKRLIFMKNEKLLLSIIEASLHKMFKNLPGTLKLQNIGLISSIPVEKSVSIKENQNALSPLDKLKQFRSRSYVPINEKSGKERVRNTASAVKSFPSVRDMFVKLEPDSRPKNSEEKMDEISRFEEVPEKSVTEESSRSEERPSPNDVTDLQTVQVEILENVEEGVEVPENVNSLKKRKPEVMKGSIIAEPEKTAKRIKTDDGMTGATKNNRKSVTINFSLNDVKESIRKRTTETPETDKIKFYSKINPSENKSAEKELIKELHKDSFKQMIVIGQFNLGFIIAKLGSDLFIIDQHATDEKYNFENLQRTTKIETQKFVVPQNLNLTVEKEELLLHHSDVIRENGFDFTFDPDERPTNRVKLTAVPLSKNWIFGREDIDEMLFLLENAPEGKICRPSRLRDMFASRACRKSVMIGTALNQFEMRRLIDHMGEIEQPWNCPHGRPTIRHLINVNMIRRSD